MRVLLVEDHQVLAETVSDMLRGEGMAADVARDGRAALDRSAVNCYDAAAHACRADTRRDRAA
jgi:DNA-binding response OmpR family regulator